MLLKLLLIGGTIANLAAIAYRPVSTPLESYYHYGFTYELKTKKAGPIPSFTVVARHFGSPKYALQNQVVEKVEDVVNESTGANLDFDITNGHSDDEIKAIFEALVMNYKIRDVGQISYILATAKHESDNFRTMHEYGTGGHCGNSYKYDGFAGVGLVQLTWKGNYTRAKNKLGFSHMTEAEFCQEVSTRSDVALTILIEGMMGGWFTGRSLPQYVDGNRRDYVNARRVVNGTDRAHHIASIARNYEPKVQQWLKEYGF